jgi:integrase
LPQFQPEFIEGDIVVFPASVMKAGRTHTLPLTDAMRREIENHPFSGWNEDYQKQQLDRLAGIPHFTAHDLRRSWATLAAEELDVAPHIIEAVLAHASGSQVARTYNPARYIEPMRAVLLAFERHLETQSTLETPQNAAYHSRA